METIEYQLRKKGVVVTTGREDIKVYFSEDIEWFVIGPDGEQVHDAQGGHVIIKWARTQHDVQPDKQSSKHRP